MSRPELLDVFDKVLAYNTAGLPEDASVKWTRLSQGQIVEEMGSFNCVVGRYRPAR